jgi:tetratricopeptide (TPR) repeat protein
MKVKYAVVAFSLSLLVAANASAQLIAGSPEDALFGEIESAASDSERMELAMRFENEFPGSAVHVQILTMIMNIYNQQQDSPNAISYAQKTLEADENNVEALIALTYNLALTREDIPGAIGYGQQAVTAIGEMRSSEPPIGYTPETWTQYLDSLETSAESYLNYAQSIR